MQCINEQELLEHAKLTVSVGRQETLAKRKNSTAESLDLIPLPTLWTLKSATATRPLPPLALRSVNVRNTIYSVKKLEIARAAIFHDLTDFSTIGTAGGEQIKLAAGFSDAERFDGTVSGGLGEAMGIPPYPIVRHSFRLFSSLRVDKGDQPLLKCQPLQFNGRAANVDDQAVDLQRPYPQLVSKDAKFAVNATEPSLLHRGSDNNFDLHVGAAEIAGAAGADRGAVLIHPRVPHRIHFGKIAHVRDHDVRHQNP